MPSEGNKMQLNKEEYKNFKQIVNIFYNEEIEGINEEKEKIKKRRNNKKLSLGFFMTNFLVT